MATDTKIEWCDATANFWEGCTQISPACDGCYAKERAERFGTVEWNGPPRRVQAGSLVVRAMQREAVATGRRPFIFVNSLSDFFDNKADPDWRREALDLMRAAPDCIFLLLTKRIGNVEAMMQETGISWERHLQHVWLGITVPNQPEADRDTPKLQAAKAALKIPKLFLSVEPMLGPVDASRFMWPVHARWPAKYRSPEEAKAAGAEVTYHRQGLVLAGTPFVDWVICGGESGRQARPMHPDWARSLRDQCAAAGVPFLFKQWGEWAPTPADYANAPRSVPLTVYGPNGWTDDGSVEGEWLARVGKAKAARLLDGVEHSGRPQP
jgi:protein gp37